MHRLRRSQGQCGALARCALVALLSIAPGADAQPDFRSDIVLRAMSLLGAPYRAGGSSPEDGFDCSGLVAYLARTVAGRELPRRSEQMAQAAERISPEALQPGDLVFFNTLRRTNSHVAVYVGEGRFLHAPANGGRVRLEALNDRYWRARFDGAGRIFAPASARMFATAVDEPIRP